jgi:hypothetical protein
MSPPTTDTFWVPVLLPILLVLVVYRLTRLITTDDFPPVLWVRDRLAGGWRPLTDPEWERLRVHGREILNPMRAIDGVENRYITRASWSPHWLAELITCPWCASGWVSGAVVLATDLTVGLPVPWLYGPAVWGAAALLSSQEWS